MRVHATPPADPTPPTPRAPLGRIDPGKASSGRRGRVRHDTAEISEEGKAASAAALSEAETSPSARRLRARRGDADQDRRVTRNESPKLEPG